MRVRVEGWGWAILVGRHLGLRVVRATRSEGAHDALLAACSHMPHIVAYALTRALERDACDPMAHGGGALRDMTRIAGSDPFMWTDISVTNQNALIKAIDGFQKEIILLRELIASANAVALADYFAICRAHRRRHDDILNPLPAGDSEETS